MINNSSVTLELGPPPKCKVLVNSVTRNGVHLVGSVLEIIGMTSASYGFIKRKNVQLNFRTSQHLSNYFLRWAKKTAPISIGSPRMVRIKLIERICAKVKDTEYMLSHIPYSHAMEILLNDLEWKNIIIIRDPRDQCASVLHKLKKKKNNPASYYLFKQLKTDSDRIKSLIDGYDGLHNKRGMVGLPAMYKSVMDWKGKSNFIFVKFEDLIGPNGGGSLERQKATIVKILKHLEYENYDNDKIVDWIGNHCFGMTNSFWKGQVGNWKTVFDKKVYEVFKDNIADLLDQLGYEV